MKYIKQMQGLALSNNASDGPSKIVNDKFRNVPPKVTSQYNAAVTKSKHRLSQPSLEDKSISNNKVVKVAPPPRGKPPKPKLEIKQLREFGEIQRRDDVSECLFNEKEKITHRGIQTERNEDLSRLYECGVIKYPSPSVLDHINHTRRKSIKVIQDHGDTERSLPEDKLNALRMSYKYDY